MTEPRWTRLHTIALILFLLAGAISWHMDTDAQADDTMTIAECITRSGYTSEVYGEAATLHGSDA